MISFKLTAFWRIVFVFVIISSGLALPAVYPVSPEKVAGGNESLIACPTGELFAELYVGSNSVVIVRLEDRRFKKTFISRPTPVFTLMLRRMDVSNKPDYPLSSTNGWRKVSAVKSKNGFAFLFSEAEEPSLTNVSVKVILNADKSDSSLRWQIEVDNRSGIYALRNVVFPYLNLSDPGSGIILFPRGPGEIQQDVWSKDFHYRGHYPGGWCSMQFVAAYSNEQNPSGLYIGYHDPYGSTKHIDIRNVALDKNERILKVVFETPAPNFETAGNDFALNGSIVWKLFRGDWFDAAKIYRSWVVREAKWYPRGNQFKGGLRTDTPEWMRNLDVWVMTGGSPKEVVPRVKEFRKLIGAPLGFHWYNWHQIPFDNDYPHYFPAKTNFMDAISELQNNQIYVMPYINGRLWDTRDKGTNDWQFTAIALSAATKQEDGKPFIESYGSKEANGEPVRLAVMCPTTKLWQNKVKEIALNLLNTNGTRAVYIDQIAAAAPVLCADKKHNHPSGGGYWWNEGYWQMLENIRREKPENSALTTECNGEPFIRWMDGYLTWHWQYNNQVPAFPAVYGGAIQMFGRAYRGGDTKDLAFRMKAAQQLVFGEQIGWFDPDLASQPQNLAFLKKLLKTRSLIRRFFIVGEMARPPHLEGEIPSVKADWQWSGQWWVTTSAVFTGAFQSSKETVLIFVNVSDQKIDATLRFKPQDYGLKQKKVNVSIIKNGDELQKNILSLPVEEKIELQPQSVEVWRIW
ncbi:MAG: DUF6259 domain-containing protein [Verrucomicrobiia bacterium]